MELKKCSSCRDTTSTAKELYQNGKCKGCSNYKRVFCQINFEALHQKRNRFWRYPFVNSSFEPQKDDGDKGKE